MKISVITVCYNSSATIEKTFQSVASQTYDDIEYIVIDGGSSDCTPEIIKKYNHVITSWVSEKDQGLYDAMNKGIRKATGEYIGILNSDDTFYDIHTLENIAGFLQQEKVDASIGNIVQHNGGRVIRTYSSQKWCPKDLKVGFMPPHPSIFFKKELFDKLGYYSLDFDIGADYELITRYFLKHNISFGYSNITTTSMLMGGLSSSGLKSYLLLSKENGKALNMNNIDYSKWKMYGRGLRKLKQFIPV